MDKLLKKFQDLAIRASKDRFKQTRYSVPEAMKLNPETAFLEITEAIFEELFTEEGQSLVIEGLNETCPVFIGTASHNKVYQYTGAEILKPLDFIKPDNVRCYEKDADCCELKGCQLGCRPMWCVENYENRQRRMIDLCNFCAHLEGLNSLDRCFGKSPECRSCPNQKTAIEMNGGV